MRRIIEGSMIELYEKDCRYCTNECNTNFSVCQCNSHLCNECLIGEFKMTTDKKDGASCTVCKTSYIATYKKCTCLTILLCCRNNTIKNSTINTSGSVAIICSIVTLLCWITALLYYLLINDYYDVGDNVLDSMFLFIADILICTMIIVVQLVYINTPWYINTTLIYFIIYTIKNIILIQFFHEDNVPLYGMILAVNIVFNIYLLIYCIFDCKNAYSDQMHTSQNMTIRAEL